MRFTWQEENLMRDRVSMLLKGCASAGMLPSSLCEKKACNSAHEQTQLSKSTIDSVLRQRELSRDKDLSASSRLGVTEED
jgi:hypothetical protein